MFSKETIFGLTNDFAAVSFRIESFSCLKNIFIDVQNDIYSFSNQAFRTMKE